MVIRVHALTHTGAVRSSNEDTVAVDDWIAANDLTRPKVFELNLDAPHGVFAADGMGGHPGGDVASHAVMRFAAARAPAVADVGTATDLLCDANAHLYDLMAVGEGPPGMGTTLAGLVVRRDGVVVLNVGDSKVYRFDPEGGLVQLSYDDTPGPRCRDGRTAAHTTPMLSQCLGGQSRKTPVTPHAGLWPPLSGARYLVCTDGLSDLVAPSRLAGILARHDDAPAVAAMFDDAMAQGGRDNITIALVSGMVGPGL